MKTTYYKNSGKVIGCEPNAKETSEIGVTDMMCTTRFIEPHFDGKVFYEGAKPESIAADKNDRIAAVRAEYEARIDKFASIEVQKAYFRTDYVTPPDVIAEYDRLRTECNLIIENIQKE